MSRRLLVGGCLAAGFAGLLWAALNVAGAWRDQATLARARRSIALGRYAEARPWLIEAARRRPLDGEVAYLLGLCEQAQGQAEAARLCWTEVPERSPFAPAARRALARLDLDTGRFASAENELKGVIRDGGREAVEARYALSQLYYWEGRDDDQRRLLRAGWERSSDRPGDLRDLWFVDSATALVDSVRAQVERASAGTPDDDRVWLAQTHLDTLAGRYDAARARLDACLKRRPDDPAVWRARLGLAVAAGRADDALAALPHLPSDRFEPAEAAKLRAWLAAQRNDPAAERAALERLVELSPGDVKALERLAVLAAQAGETERAAALRTRKTEADRATDRYGTLLGTSGPISADYGALGQLAETLGRWFDARGWWTLALRQNPGNNAAREALARLEPRIRGLTPVSGQTLAALLEVRPPSTTPGPIVSKASGVRLPAFRDDAEAAGLRFTFDNGQSALRQLPETSAGGVAVLDYDGDGWLDVYCLQGGPFPPGEESSQLSVVGSRLKTHAGARGDTASPTTDNRQLTTDNSSRGDRLFHNRGDGTFDDATERSGLARFARGYGHGVAVGDYDNDGDPDLFVTRWRAYALYRNRGDGTFEDVTDAAGLGGARDWPTSAAWADLDNDGDLDLYVCHYLEWDAEHPRLCKAAAGDERHPYEYCTPRHFPALPDHLFRNDGGRFTDVSAAAGITAADTEGRGFGVVAADLDDDGRMDLFVANDTTANFLFHNDGGLKFTECGLSAGVGSNASGGFQAGMGAACGDLDGDGRLDLLVTNFYGESTSFYHNLGGTFEDATTKVGLGAPSRFLLGFGIVVFDANNDGRLDVMTANGHVNDERPSFPYEMPAQLLVGGAHGRLTDVSERSGPPWQVKRVGRGLATGDLDNDGRVDAVLVAQNAPLAWFHNQTAGGHFVLLRLEGSSSNRDGVGARVVLSSVGRRQVSQRTGGGSFQSASDGRLQLGLGDSDRVDALEVRWPSGRVDRFEGLEADRGYRLKEGSSRAEPLAGFARP